ncbi:MAG: prephenate dehydrogenase/arogenate dehydrogenase family protein, partial [Desulfovibrionales bacterium]
MQLPDKTVLIGGQGRMGRMIGERLLQNRVPFTSLDQPLEQDVLMKEMTDAGVVLLCIPITAMDSVLGSVCPYLASGTVLADIGSVKVVPLQKMMRSYSGPVVGTHPLFGPAPEGDDPLRVAVCPGRDSSGLETIESLFQHLGFRTFRSTAEDHDRAMAYIQGLNFVTTISYLSCLPQE